jgi:L-lactate utilization protein LutB
MFEQIKTRAEAVSAKVHYSPTKIEALDFILQLLHKDGIADAIQSYTVWVKCLLLTGIDRKELVKRVPGLRFNITRAVAAESMVFKTDNSEKSKEYMFNLAWEMTIKSIVKTKSMTSGEIQLNPYFKEHGIGVRETDREIG